MKKITYLLFGLVSSIAVAQVSYLSSDFAAVNEQYIVSHSTTGLVGNNFVQTGANTTWDYANLVPSSQDTIEWQNPNNAGYKTVWCFLNGFLLNCNAQFNNNFNLATKLTNGLTIQGFGLTNVINHLKLSASSLEEKMIGAAITFNGTTIPFAATYQMADVLYQFPINFNDVYTNGSELNIDLTNLNVPIQYASVGQRTNVIDGWGSLTTPFGTFASVLKMKSTLVNQVTLTTNGVTTPTTISTVSYKWFDKAYGIPVLQVDGSEVGGQFVATDIAYFDIQRCLAPNALFGFFPIASDFNPVTNNASVSFINASSNYETLSWDFGDDLALSTAVNPTHNFSCPGTYDVELTVTNVFCDPDQIDTLTIPVTITDSQNAFTTNVTVGNASLFADRDLAGTTYQWLDCDTGNFPIAGATSQIFTPIEPNGDYAVQLTTNGCVSISDCYNLFGLSNSIFDTSNNIDVYPNPTTGILNITSIQDVKSVFVYDVLGKIVTTKPNLIGSENGIYFVKITTETGMVVKKIIKK